MNFDMTSGIVAVDIFSILIGIVLCYGNIFEAKNKHASGLMYTIMVLTNLTALIFDAVSYQNGSDSLFYVSNTLTMSLSQLVILEFIMFMAYYQIEMNFPFRFTIKNEYVSSVLLCTICFIITFYACSVGWIFSRGENGEYVDGEYYFVYLITNIVTTTLALLIIIKNRKKFSNHVTVAAITYVLVPATSALINTVIPEFSFAYPACSISLLAFYIMTQSQAALKLEVEKQQARFFATHDPLTGVFGRLAYQEKLDELAKAFGSVGVVFTDVNGLKVTNDKFGHVAGDDLLKEYAVILEKVFTKDFVFRISGDEFVVIYDKGNKETFERMFEHFRTEISKNEIASIGSRYGKASELKTLIDEAEEIMYEQKELYHIAHPESCR